MLLALHCSFIAPRTPLRPHATALPRAACHTAAALAAVLCDEQVDDALPQQLYLEYFSPDYRLNYNRRPVRAGGGARGGVGGGWAWAWVCRQTILILLNVECRVY